MGAVRLFLAARAAVTVSTLWVAAVLICVLLAKRAIPVDFARIHAARDIPVIEFVPIVTGCMVAGLLRPRMFEWERIAIRPVGMLQGMLTAATIAASTLPVFLAVGRLPTSVPWGFVSTNVAIVTSLGFVLTALLGATTGAVLTLLTFLSACLVQNLAPSVAEAFIPLGRLAAPEPHWATAIGACLVSAAIVAYTRGASFWSWNRLNNEN